MLRYYISQIYISQFHFLKWLSACCFRITRQYRDNSNTLEFDRAVTMHVVSGKYFPNISESTFPETFHGYRYWCVSRAVDNIVVVIEITRP